MANRASAVTMNGFVGTIPKTFQTSNGVPMCTFRLASTQRYFDRKEQSWKDSTTTWITVKAYRKVAENAMSSISKGDPLIVHGRLATDQWETGNGQQRSACVLEATSIGHDLAFGQSVFRKNVDKIQQDVQHSFIGDLSHNQRDEHGEQGITDEEKEVLFEYRDNAETESDESIVAEEYVPDHAQERVMADVF